MPPAVHRQVLAGRTSQDRAKARVGISLRDSGITDKTRLRYKAALAALLPFITLIASSEELDCVVEEWIEMQWINGSTLGQIGDALCGLQFYCPEFKGHLRGSWRLYKNWRRLEIPCRAPPISADIVRAFVSWLIDKEEVSGAFLIALAFHAYLRTGEALSLHFSDLQVNDSTGVVTVRGGKSGLRSNMDEAIAIYDLGVLELARLAKLLPHASQPRAKVWNHSPNLFRKVFQQCVEHFGLHKLELKPYSLRRGGATHDYMLHGILEPILLRGRWHSLQVARLYIEDGLAQLPSLQLSRPQRSHIAAAGQPLLLFLQPMSLTHALCWGSWKNGI